MIWISFMNFSWKHLKMLIRWENEKNTRHDTTQQLLYYIFLKMFLAVFEEHLNCKANSWNIFNTIHGKYLRQKKKIYIYIYMK